MNKNGKFDGVKLTDEIARDEATEARREFLKKAGKFGITVPMAALLLSVKSKDSSAKSSYGSPSGKKIKD